MLTEERLIVREGAWMVLRLNATSIATVGVLLGVVFLFAGINEVGVASLAPGGWKVWHYLMAVIFLLGGLYGFVRPRRHGAKFAFADPDRHACLSG